jgi:hypothetical protein
VSTDGEQIAPVRRQTRAHADADSRLRSVFLLHQLIAGLPAIPGVAPPTAKFVVEQIVERLLGVPDGLEPLMLLQRDASLLSRSTVTAVVAVVLARAGGWPEDSLADLGAAALLSELGTVLDDSAPGVAGFTWLLDQGCADFWLRAAMIARLARDPLADGEAMPGAVAVVRTAVAITALPVAARAELRGALRQSPAAAGVPAPVLDLATRVFGS